MCFCARLGTPELNFGALLRRFFVTDSLSNFWPKEGRCYPKKDAPATWLNRRNRTQSNAIDAIGVPGATLACSDKIAKWQVLGAQGACVSVLVPTPVTFASIVVGRKFDGDAIRLGSSSHKHGCFTTILRSRRRRLFSPLFLRFVICRKSLF